jgi:glyoxylase-like metal-dependent hydrolase (beta-lactamase superfamily II)
MVGTDAGPLVWACDPLVDRVYAERIEPVLRGLLARPVDMVLPAHGPPTLSGGAEALEAALTARFWRR